MEGRRLSMEEDKWWWDFEDDNNFSVKATRRCIEQILLPYVDCNMIWNVLLPRKVNIFIWRLLYDRLPLRTNLVTKGIDDPSILCPLCCSNVET